VVETLARSEKRQAAQTEKKLQLEERRLDQERELFEADTARRERAE